MLISYMVWQSHTKLYKKFIEEDILYYEDNEMGYILDIGLKQATELYDNPNNYPLAPEIIHLIKDMINDKK